MTRAWLRWLPAAIVPAMIAGGAVLGSAQGSAAVELPAKSPGQVLELAANSDVHAFSGTVQQTSDLGLPQLPAGGSGAASPSGSASTAAAGLELLTGSHTARIYLDGPAKARVQVMDQLSERDVVRNGSAVWLYDSSDNTATQLRLPTRPASNKTPGPAAGGPAATAAPDGPAAQMPAELAHHFLAAVGPSTKVSVGPDTTVAGRAAYDLVLRPRSTDTLIASVSIAVDAGTGLPLSVELRARGQQDPAFQVGFTTLNLQVPDATLFEFTPPAGATVTTQTLPARRKMDLKQNGPQHNGPQKKARREHARASARPGIIGSGWGAIVELPAGTAPSNLADSLLVTKLSRAVPGGRVLSTSLMNVFLDHDGRTFVGSVPPARLQAAAEHR